MIFRRAILTAVAAVSIGCGSDSSNTPTAPSGGGGSSGGNNNPPVATTTITITSAGVSPQRITVAPGSRVTFVNNDSRQHEMNSDPHPNHGDCPAIDDVGFIAAGQSKQTGNLNVVRTCGFHDHNQPTATSLQGQIIVQ
jgi:plastocyanin